MYYSYTVCGSTDNFTGYTPAQPDETMPDPSEEGMGILPEDETTPSSEENQDNPSSEENQVNPS